jgi:hypothetical protein
MAHKHIVYMMMTDSASRTHDRAGLENYAPMLEALALQDDHQPYLAIARRAQGVTHGLIGEPAKAIKRLNEAMQIFTKLDMKWQIGRTFFEMGEVARNISEAGRARDFYHRAMTAFETMGALPDLERIQALLTGLN